METDPSLNTLLEPWPGPFGGLPPFDAASPEALEAAFSAAAELRRLEVQAIASRSEPANFSNVIEALERSGAAFQRVDALARYCAAALATGAMPEVVRRLSAQRAALEDEWIQNDALFARVDQVWRERDRAGLTPEQVRLTEVIRDRFLRAGAGLPPADRARLSEINGRLSSLMARFGQNLIEEGDALAETFETAEALEGLPASGLAMMADAAAARGAKGFATPLRRAHVWQVLTHGVRRNTRERVWRMWSRRGGADNGWDNRPLIAEMVALRREKARLLGFADFATLVLADRMARTPQTALDLLGRVWDRVARATADQDAELQTFAQKEGADYVLMPWDRLFFAEKLRKQKFGLDAEAVRAFLNLDRVIDAILAAASRLHDLEFAPLADAPTPAKEARAFSVRQGAEIIGILYFDVLQRPGKQAGSFQMELRPAQTSNGSRTPPIACVVSSIQPSPAGGPTQIGWEYANVLFHEVGHALHMLMGRAAYPSVGSMAVAWDFIELPALLNERWIGEREFLRPFLAHQNTGVPMDDAMLDALAEGARYDRIFSLTLDYLACAVVDLKLHQEGPGPGEDAVAFEARILREMGFPASHDLILPLTASVHLFAGAYPAGLYSYLWADVMAADVAEVFLEAPGGLFDPATASRWRESILSVGHTIAADDAFRRFRGRNPDPEALFRRFGLAA